MSMRMKGKILRDSIKKSSPTGLARQSKVAQIIRTCATLLKTTSTTRSSDAHKKITRCNSILKDQIKYLLNAWGFGVLGFWGFGGIFNHF